MLNVIYPPRPQFSIHPIDLNKYDKADVWLTQYKYNGSRNLIHIDSNNEVRVWSRHGRVHKRYNLPNNVRKEIQNLPGLIKGREYWLDTELLDKTKEKDTKEKIVIFDVLADGKYLFNTPNQIKRLELLNNICGKPNKLDSLRGIGYVISENLWMAPHFMTDFTDHFNEISEIGEVEGLVLRKRNSVLDNFGTKEYSCRWLVRCRREHRNYDF